MAFRFSMPHEYNLWSWVVGKATSQTDTASLVKLKLNINACVAQLVVQLIRNEQVAGSNPVTSSKEEPRKYVVPEVSFYV